VRWKATTWKSVAILINRRVKRKRGQATELRQSHKGNDLHPSMRLGKHGTCRSCQVTALKVGKDASMTANYRGVSITENIASAIVVGFSYMTNDTTTCDACGTRYAFTSYKDRCPVCCPDQARDDDESGNQEDRENDDND
jgi:hypothetical protein